MFQKSAEVRSWIKNNHQILSITSTILGMVHFDQYQAGIAMLEDTYKHPEKVSDESFFAEVLEGWGCPFMELHIFSNIKTALYRGTKPQRMWFDLLLSFGQYNGGTVILEDINTHLRYPTGTAIVLGTRILRHTVRLVESGERMSFKFMMREKVVKCIGAEVDDGFSHVLVKQMQ